MLDASDKSQGTVAARKNMLKKVCILSSFFGMIQSAGYLFKVFPEDHNLCGELDVGSIEALLSLPPVGASPAHQPTKDTTLQFRVYGFFRV